MSNATFANGIELTSTANTPDTTANIFWGIITSIFGIDPIANPNDQSVLIAWQPLGQPGFGIDQDVCFLQVTSVDIPFARVRDNIWNPHTSADITNEMGFTQVWQIRVVLYGPNCYDRARLILSAVTLDWVHDALQAQNFYLVVGPKRPTYVPEGDSTLKTGQWWKRTDIELWYNELVIETMTLPTAIGVGVTVVTDTGVSESIQIGPSTVT